MRSRSTLAVLLTVVLALPARATDDVAAWGREAVDVARGYIGTQRHDPAVKKWLGWDGLGPDNAYCLAFATGSWHEARLDQPFPFPRMARNSSFWRKARADRWHYKTFTPRDVAFGVDTPQPGDLVIFAHNPDVLNWDGHAGVTVCVVSDSPELVIDTIEGNTSSNDKGDQRMGGVVAPKRRRANMAGLVMIGFVRPL